MSKYTYEEKLEAVLRIEQEMMPVCKSAKILGCSKGDVQNWLKLYREHGPDALQNGGARYDGEFKKMVVEYMCEHHLSCRETSAKFGIKTHTSVSKWELIYYREGPEGLLKAKPRGRPKEMVNYSKTENDLSEESKEDLIAEVQRLRMENEYLKKLNALVQERIARENGKEPPSSMN